MVLLVMGMITIGLIPMANAGTAVAVGGNGGNGGAAVGVGVCAVNIAVFGNAGCRNNGVAKANGGNGGKAVAIARG